MSDPITIEEVRRIADLAEPDWKARFPDGSTLAVFDLYVSAWQAGYLSQSETSKAQVEEIERLQSDFDTVNAVNNALQVELSKLKQELDEAYERAARIADQFIWYDHDNCSPDEGHLFVAKAIRALKSDPTEGK